MAGWVSLGVLGGLSAVAEAAGIIDDVRLIANGISIEVDTRNGPFDTFEAIYLKLDYSVEFRLHEPTLLGIESDPQHPVRLRFRNVGLAYHHSTKDLRFLSTRRPRVISRSKTRGLSVRPQSRARSAA